MLAEMLSQINFSDPYFPYAVFFSFFNPFIWNFVARIEYNTKFFSKLAGGKFVAGYAFSAFIFTIGIVRDVVYKLAIDRQQSNATMAAIPFLAPLGYLCFLAGQTLVLSSMYQLGCLGTYLGDHFGILKDSRITSFPFNVVDHPMYLGSTLSFLSYALTQSCPAGLFITGCVALAYYIAGHFEGPFTSMIYERAAQETVDVKKTK